MRALRRSQTVPATHNSSLQQQLSSPSTTPPSSSSSSSSYSWVHFRSVLLIVNSSSPASCAQSDRGLISPWSHRKRKHALSARQLSRQFMPDGKLHDGGLKLLKKVRNAGIDPSIRAEVWPFLLGVYDLSSSKEERETIRKHNRKEYDKLRRQCQRLLKCSTWSFKLSESHENGYHRSTNEDADSSGDDEVVIASESLSHEEKRPSIGCSAVCFSTSLDGVTNLSHVANNDASGLNTDSSEYPEVIQAFSSEAREECGTVIPSRDNNISSRVVLHQDICTSESFGTWQRIIRVDALRTNSDWVQYLQSQDTVTEARARRFAEAVGLKNYDHLEPCRIFHAARLVAILEAYALYDSETGYCQGMSDLLSPIIAIVTDDNEAFWCFVGFMRKVRYNFRLDEVGIRRQLNKVSKIIKLKDSHLYRHLEKLQAEDCFFVYRMVVVLFRRELTFEQTLCLWEVMWADQAAIRCGIGKSARTRMRQRAPPTDDLLLYAIAACVLERRKLIIEKYSSMDEIMRECHSMSGQLDVRKLLDDAHDLVITLHDKIETSLE